MVHQVEPPDPVFYFALAYDHLCDGIGSKARCDALMEAALDTNPLWRYVVLTGGKDPNRPEMTSIADQMNAYICRKHPDPKALVSPAKGWGSLAEIGEFFRVARTIRPDGNATVRVSTNPGHMPRTLVYMNALKPNGWTIRPVYAPHRFCWMDRLVKEPVKLLISLAKFPALKRSRATR